MDNPDKIKDERPLGIGGIIGTVIFFLTFTVWILVIGGAYIGVPEGLFSVKNVYGFDALKEIFTTYSIIPIVPACFIYEIIFTVIYIKRHLKKLSIIALALFATTFINVLVPCLFFEYKKEVLLNECRPDIIAHLTTRYGKDFATSVKIKVEDYDSKYFYLINPATEKPASIHYSIGNSGGLSDDIMNHIITEEVSNAFDSFAAAKLGLPENVEIDTRMESADLSNYKAGDDPSLLFGSADFGIKSVTIKMEHCEANEVLPVYQQAWVDIVPLIGDHYYNNSIQMNIISETGSEDFAKAQIDYPANYNSYQPTVSITYPYTGAYYLDLQQ